MPWAIAIGPAAALIGIAAVFFVLRRKSVDKRSMYSARRSQIEHKVRAARQRTLAPHGKPEPAPDAGAAPPPAPPPFAAAQPTATAYEPSAYEPPPAAAAPAAQGIPDAPSSSPWDVGPAVAPPAGPFEAPGPPPPAFEPAGPTEQAWTPTPGPVEAPGQPSRPEPLAPAEPARPAMVPAEPAAWSVVGESKQSGISVDPESTKKKGREQEAAPAGSWTLASGDAPGTESEDTAKAPGQAVAIAQYAVLVVGLVAVLIGVLIMVAGSPVK